MHTYKTEDGFIFYYNSDFSGDVKITRKFGGTVAHISKLPGKDLIEFVVETYVIPLIESDGAEMIDKILAQGE